VPEAAAYTLRIRMSQDGFPQWLERSNSRVRPAELSWKEIKERKALRRRERRAG
jgi:hypothetical protein